MAYQVLQFPACEAKGESLCLKTTMNYIFSNTKDS